MGPRARALSVPSGRTAARAAIVVVAAVLTVRLAADGIAVWLARNDPVAAARTAPQNARLAAAAARARVAQGAQAASPEVRSLVARSLAHDVTIPPAIELRAVQASLAQDHRRESRLFDLSRAISRRSLPTRLWLIQRSVDRGDVKGALADFDIALRTSTAAPEVLFPVLARATSDPELAEPIARMLDRPSDWRESFLHYAVTSGTAVGAGEVALRMRDRRALTARQLDQVLVGELVAERAFALARRVEDTFHAPPPGPGLVRDADFSNPAARPPFGWSLTQKGEIGAERALVGGRPALSFQALAGGAGPMATQLLTLPPGGYRLSARSAAAFSDPTALPYWTLTCADEGGPQIALVDQPAPAGSAAEVDFTSPRGCSAQWLALNLRASDAPERSGAIGSVRIESRP